MPGYGFSARPAFTGWGTERIARAWAVLMECLGYTRYVAQGGDWGTAVAAAMARQVPTGCSASTPASRRWPRPASSATSATAPPTG